MARKRRQVHGYTADGPVLVAIHDVLQDLYDLLDERLPEPWAKGPVPVKEPAPAGPPRTAVPVSEPAPDLPEPPPRAGRGSSLPAWHTWAVLAGVTLTEDMTRDQIIGACIDAGILAEA